MNDQETQSAQREARSAPPHGSADRIRDALDGWGTPTDRANLLASHVHDMLDVMTDIYKVATGENQVADDDTGGLAWIADKLRPLVVPPNPPNDQAHLPAPAGKVERKKDNQI